MYKTDRQGIIEQVQQFSKYIRIFYIIGFVVVGFAIIAILLSMLLGSVVDLPIAAVGAIGGIALIIVIIALLIQIYFFKYYGKVAKQTQAGIYTSATPALVNLVFSVIGILSTIRDFFKGEGFPIISLAISLISIYLVYGVYNGLKMIEKNRYFDNVATEATAVDYSPVQEAVSTSQNQTTNTANRDNGSWVKED